MAICGVALHLRREMTDIDSAYEPDEPASTSAAAAEPEELVVGRIYRREACTMHAHRLSSKCCMVYSAGITTGIIAQLYSYLR